MENKIFDLIDEQCKNWPMAAQNFKGLESVKTKTFDYPNGELAIQFNPERIRSSAAKVDAQSIEKRPCFLCEKNRPEVQNGIDFNGNYTILVNPFPIFTKHLTIPHVDHTLQRIKGKFGDMLDLSKALPSFTVFYNGPRCGASAPDHFHFQAGNRGVLPIEEIDLENSEFATPIIQAPTIQAYGVNDGTRRWFAAVSDNRESCLIGFKRMYAEIERHCPAEEEPMMNILVLFKDNAWHIHLFPRQKHRPWQYEAEDEKNILLSPASVDFGGVCILPMEKDFENIKLNDLLDIFDQCGISEEAYNNIIQTL